MEFWEKTKYLKWYKSHRRFSFIAKFCIDLYEDKNRIPLQIFSPFLKSLSCHSKSEEKMFADVESMNELFKEHSTIISTKEYTEEEKYNLCKSLLLHMKEEEDTVKTMLVK